MQLPVEHGKWGKKKKKRVIKIKRQKTAAAHGEDQIKKWNTQETDNVGTCICFARFGFKTTQPSLPQFAFNSFVLTHLLFTCKAVPHVPNSVSFISRALTQLPLLEWHVLSNNLINIASPKLSLLYSTTWNRFPHRDEPESSPAISFHFFPPASDATATNTQNGVPPAIIY